MDSTTEEMKEAFDLIDKAQIGKINREQLELLIKILGFPPQELDNQAEYSFSNVQNIIANMNHHDTHQLENQFLTLCQRYDPENKGFITIPQMAQVFDEIGGDPSGEEFLETMRLGEHDYGDDIDYKNFLSQMMG